MPDFLSAVEQATHYQERAGSYVASFRDPLVSALIAENAPPSLVDAARRIAPPLGPSGKRFAAAYHAAERAGWQAGPATRPAVVRAMREMHESAAMAADATRKYRARHSGFWNHVLDGVIAVTSSPIFTAVVTIATAAIPGVGAVLAPVAAIVQRKVTAMVKDAHDGHADAQKMLGAAAEVAAVSAAAALQMSPEAAAIVDKGKQIAGYARTVYQSPEAKAVTDNLLAARKAIVQAQQGDAHAAASIMAITEGAKRGHAESIRRLAFIAAIAKGMRDGHVPRATRAEKRHYGKKAILKLAGLSPALVALAQSAAHPSSPIAKMRPVSVPLPPTGLAADEDDSDDTDDSEQDETGAVRRRRATNLRALRPMGIGPKPPNLRALRPMGAAKHPNLAALRPMGMKPSGAARLTALGTHPAVLNRAPVAVPIRAGILSAQRPAPASASQAPGTIPGEPASFGGAPSDGGRSGPSDGIEDSGDEIDEDDGDEEPIDDGADGPDDETGAWIGRSGRRHEEDFELATGMFGHY